MVKSEDPFSATTPEKAAEGLLRYGDDAALALLRRLAASAAVEDGPGVVFWIEAALALIALSDAAQVKRVGG